MLNGLDVGRSKIRNALFTIFFTNPAQKYYLGELKRILGYSRAGIYKELKKLKSSNLFNIQKVGNTIYYSVKKRHYLFRKLKDVVSKTISIEETLRKAIKNTKTIFVNGKIKGALIYGSFTNKINRSISKGLNLAVVGNLITKSYVELKRARGNINKDKESAYEYAYNAMLNMGLALMLAQESKENKKNKNNNIRFVSVVLGDKLKKLTSDDIDSVIKERKFIHKPSDISYSKKEVLDVVNTAGEFVKKASRLIKDENIKK